ncbi:MAG: protein phosphatase 2C domain-containing protein, partial [Endomicrobium sp.]|nr:protein phosphatase 2C domain-containing protein [Endomicrobium sp.]
MKILYCAKSDIGLLRTENQDAYSIDAGNDFFILCDGMGGAGAGSFASADAAEVILKSFKTLDQKQIKTIVRCNDDINVEILRPIASIMLANRHLYNLTLKYPKLAGMGSTVVAAKFESETALLHMYYVGDSRLYRIRADDIELLTKDHSKVNELIASGKACEDEIKNTEMQCIITRALGIESSVKIDYRAYVTNPGDYYIMCSDGLNGEIKDSDIKSIVETNKDNLFKIPLELIKAANKSGGRDNITVLTFKIEDDGQFFEIPKNYAENVLTFSGSESKQYLFEDTILLKLSELFNIEVPKSMKMINVFTNPVT